MPDLPALARRSGTGFAALLGLAVAAFWPSYLARPFDAIDAHTHVHALPHDVLDAACSFALADLILWPLVRGWRALGPHGRLLPATLAVFVIVQVGWFTLAQTAAWRGTAETFRHLTPT